jgi:hypothetical protein
MVDWSAVGVIFNAVLVFVLVGVTVYYAWQTKRQNDYSRLNMKKDRLYKEVDNLIKPLYDVLMQMLTPVPSGFSQSTYSTIYSDFVKDQYKFLAYIMANKYLGPESLRRAIDLYYYYVVNPDNSNFEAVSKLFEITKIRYEEIQKELDAIYKELEDKSWWKFGK